jgi:hypothetical protein
MRMARRPIGRCKMSSATLSLKSLLTLIISLFRVRSRGVICQMISDKKENARDGRTGQRTHLPLGQQTALEDCRFADVRDWKRRGLLSGYSSFPWTWLRDGVQQADIRVAAMNTSVTLSYRYRRDGGEGHSIDDRIALTTTPCHLGGECIWFLCPGCSGRAGAFEHW